VLEAGPERAFLHAVDGERRNWADADTDGHADADGDADTHADLHADAHAHTHADSLVTFATGRRISHSRGSGRKPVRRSVTEPP